MRRKSSEQQNQESTCDTRVWQLTSTGGSATECVLTRVGSGHRLIIVHAGTVAASEVYVSENEARRRAWEVNQALLEKGWSAG